MKWLSFLFLSTLSLHAFGDHKPGSQCGLTDEKNDTTWTKTKSLFVSEWKEEKVKQLDTLTKQQLIIAAKDLTKGEDGFATEIKIKTTWDAINALRENSEGEDVAVEYYSVNNLSMTQVVFYPGGNPVGVLFKTGTKKIYATNSDDHIECR